MFRYGHARMRPLSSMRTRSSFCGSVRRRSNPEPGFHHMAAESHIRTTVNQTQ